MFSYEEQSDLKAYGWDAFFQGNFDKLGQQGLEPARVAREERGAFQVVAGRGEIPAVLSGRLRYAAEGPEGLPAVGDWVAIQVVDGGRKAVVADLLPRRSQFVRQAAGRRGEAQVVAANIDLVLLTTALDRDFNPRRLERYLALCRKSGAAPVVVLNKSDLCGDPSAMIEQAQEVALGVPLHCVSALSGDGLGVLAGHLAAGRTAALLGSSGVGKSTLVNRLAGRELTATGEIRPSDGRGRHTTSRRQLILLPAGGLLLDTPGMRELQLWEADEGIEEAFGDIRELAALCRFNDCSHRHEPECAVRRAVRDDRLSARRLESYHKLLREQRYQRTRRNEQARLDEKRRVKDLHRKYRRIISSRRRR